MNMSHCYATIAAKALVAHRMVYLVVYNARMHAHLMTQSLMCHIILLTVSYITFSLTNSSYTSLFASEHSTASWYFTLKTCSLSHIWTGHIEGRHSHPKLPHDLSLGKEGRHKPSRSNSQI